MIIDTMGRREDFLREYLAQKCRDAWRMHKFYKSNNKYILICSQLESPHIWGCETPNRNYRQHKRRKTIGQWKTCL